MGSVAAAVTGILVVPVAIFGGSAPETALTAPPLVEERSIRATTVPLALRGASPLARVVQARHAGASGGGPARSAIDAGPNRLHPDAPRPSASAERSRDTPRLSAKGPKLTPPATPERVKPESTRPEPAKPEGAKPAAPPVAPSTAILASASAGAPAVSAARVAAARTPSTEVVTASARKKPRKDGHAKTTGAAKADGRSGVEAMNAPGGAGATRADAPKSPPAKKGHRPAQKSQPPKDHAKPAPAAAAAPAPAAAPAQPAPAPQPLAEPPTDAPQGGTDDGHGNGNGGNGNRNGGGNGNGNAGNGGGNDRGNGNGGGNGNGDAAGKPKHEKR